MYYHMYPPASETSQVTCSCARHRGEAIAVAA
jgi:hypothetical protein